MLKHVLVMTMLLAPRAFVWGALDESTWGDGLEADSTTSLKVVIEGVSEDANKIGLTDERIEARVNQSLRKAGITPVNARRGLDEGHLYVNVNVVADGNFTISIEFRRLVFYRSGGKLFATAGSTWDGGALGYAAGDRDYILKSITEYVEVFCNEFLKANGK